MNLSKFFFLLHPNKIILRRTSKALGDNLMLSFLAREIKNAHPSKKVIIETEWPELFYNNPNVDWVIKGKKLPFYIKPKYHIGVSAKKHILDQMAKAIHLGPDRWERKLDFFMTSDDKSDVLNLLPKKYVVVCPIGKQAFAANRKEWGPESFQKVVDLLTDIPVVQIGLPSDPLLGGVSDFRTLGYPIRTCAAIIKKSLAGGFLEGGFMHLANAVNKPSVIIYGGALCPHITGYDIHINLDTKVECGPCFTSDSPMEACPTMECMKQISPELVVEKIRELVHRSDTE